MTLFAMVADAHPVFDLVLGKDFNGKKDQKTLRSSGDKIRKQIVKLTGITNSVQSFDAGVYFQVSKNRPFSGAVVKRERINICI